MNYRTTSVDAGNPVILVDIHPLHGRAFHLGAMGNTPGQFIRFRLTDSRFRVLSSNKEIS